MSEARHAFGVEALSFLDWGPYDFRVHAGECVGIGGPSGSGKTLLLRSLADLDPHEGRVYLDDMPCHEMSGPEWRRRVGLMPSDPVWWHEQVGEHFADVPLERWLRQLGFGAEVLAWPVARLSAGERQRLALIRLMSHEPRVLLLDEPTANLDEANARAVEALVGDYRREHRVPVLWVSHQEEQLKRICDRRFHLTKRQLAEG